MTLAKRPLRLLPWLVVGALLSAGCTPTYVADAARSSFTSFLTSVINTTVVNALND